MKKIVLATLFALPACCLCSALFAGAPAPLSDAEFLELALKGTPEEVMRAVKNGANVNATDESGVTALMTAASWNNDPATVKALLQAGADVLVRDKRGRDALWYTVYEFTRNLLSTSGKESCALNKAFFLALAPALQSALPDEQGRDWDFIRQCAAGTPAEVGNALANGANTNARDAYGMTALHYAARFNAEPEVAAALLKAGAKVNAQDQRGVTALMYAAACDSGGGVVKALLAGGADVNAGERHGGTVLMSAMANENPEVTVALLKAGADVNAKNRYGATALMSVESWTPVAAVEALLAAGADVNAKVEGGGTALMSAAMRGNAETVEALLAAGADVNAKKESGETALMEANGNHEVIKALLDAGADVNASNKNGATALVWAVTVGGDKPKGVEALLAGGADANVKLNERGETLLMRAAFNKNFGEIKALLAGGADVSAKDNEGHDALWYAEHSNDWRNGLKEDERRKVDEAIIQLLKAASKNAKAR